MLRFIMSSLKHYAWFKRLNAKVTYEILAKHIPATDWQFMNYGYIPQASEGPLPIAHQSHTQRCSLQMYHYLAAKASLEGKHVLEVGSGRGGGANHVASYYKPA